MWGSFRLALAGRSFVVGLLVLVFLGAGIRWLFVSQPMRYDEAYTVVGFAARPLWNAISDYHLPNNHVFHTLLVHGMVQVFGFQEWAVRLPALLAGVACIPLVYLAGTALYDRPTGLLAAAWVAFSPLLIDASTTPAGICWWLCSPCFSCCWLPIFSAMPACSAGACSRSQPRWDSSPCQRCCIRSRSCIRGSRFPGSLAILPPLANQNSCTVCWQVQPRLAC
jgi:hypothetical protein